MEGFTGDRGMVIIYDIGTSYGDCFPVPSKQADKAYDGFNEFRGK
jgi:hypothetical protein